MQSESARATTSAESAFRVQSPNSRSRFIKVIATDSSSSRIAHHLAELSWNNAEFFAPSLSASPALTAPADLLDHQFCRTNGQPAKVLDAIEAADFVLLIVHAGNDAKLALYLGSCCASQNVSSVAIVLTNGLTKSDAYKSTVTDIRRSTSLVAFIDEPDVIEAMLAALRA